MFIHVSIPIYSVGHRKVIYGLSAEITVRYGTIFVLSLSLSPPRGQFRRHLHLFFSQRRPRLGPPDRYEPQFFFDRKIVVVRCGACWPRGPGEYEWWGGCAGTHGKVERGGGKKAPKKTHTFLAHDHHAPCTLTILLSLSASKGNLEGETREKMHADQGDKCLQLSTAELVLALEERENSRRELMYVPVRTFSGPSCTTTEVVFYGEI